MEKPKEIVTSLRLKRELWEEAKIHAIKKGIKIHELVEQLLEKEVKEHG